MSGPAGRSGERPPPRVVWRESGGDGSLRTWGRCDRCRSVRILRDERRAEVARAFSVVDTESVWTGTEVVFVNVGLGEDGSAELGPISAPGIIAYDRSADVWRTVPSVGSGPGGAIVASTGSPLEMTVGRRSPRWRTPSCSPCSGPVRDSSCSGPTPGGVAIDSVMGERTEVAQSGTQTSPPPVPELGGRQRRDHGGRSMA